MTFPSPDTPALPLRVSPQQQQPDSRCSDDYLRVRRQVTRRREGRRGQARRGDGGVVVGLPPRLPVPAAGPRGQRTDTHR